MLRALLLSLSVTFLFASSFKLQAQQDSTKGKILIVAHRGAAKYAPENTIAAFLKAAEMGADYAEMDVRQTKDGVFVLMHDRNVKRTTDGKGLVSEMTLEEIKKLDAGSWFGKEFIGEKVPTLREVLKAIDGKILPDIDFKAGDVEALVQLLKEEGYLLKSNITFHSDWNTAKVVEKLTDKVLVRPSSKSGATGLERLIEEVDPPIVNIGKSAFSDYYIKQIHRKGMLAFVNALRRADKKKFMKKAIEAGCDFLQADNLDVLVPLVREHENE